MALQLSKIVPLFRVFGRRTPRWHASQRWIRDEAKRRRKLAKDDFCKTVLLSYPRSGNHLLRFFVESISSRPTLGAGDSERKAPSLLRELPVFLKTDGVGVMHSRPVLVKRHWIGDEDQFERAIFLVRNPEEALLSHSRDLATDDESYRIWVDQQVERIDQNLNWFMTLPRENRIAVSYDALRASPRELLQQVLAFLGLKGTVPPHDELVALRQKAFSALERLPRDPHEEGYAEKFPERNGVIREALAIRGLSWRVLQRKLEI